MMSLVMWQSNFENNSSRQEVIGQTLFDDAFVSPDTGTAVGIVYLNQSIEDYIYRLNAQAWSENIFTVFSYKSIAGGEYDIK